ncbi:MAG: glycerophosphodiester phosphodiesterase [Burkholderiaceae bacterium]
MTASVPWPYPRVLAHRGGGRLAPENTIAAIRVGLDHGYRAIEVDAMLAADDAPVLMHDPTLKRTGSVTAAVSKSTAAELSAIDVGAWHSPRFAGETVPTLADALKFCRDNGVWLNIEIKPAAGFERATGRSVARVTAEVYADRIRPGGDRADRVDPQVPLLSSFSTVALAAARETAPDLPRGWLVQRAPVDWRDAMKQLGCAALHVNHRYLTANVTRRIKAEGAWLFCYTVNSASRAQAICRWGVDAFCTDAIDQIAADMALPTA